MNGSDKDHYQQATVTTDTIGINPDQPRHHQSVPARLHHPPPTAFGDYPWTSQGDKDKMAQSLLSSQGATKDFSTRTGRSPTPLAR